MKPAVTALALAAGIAAAACSGGPQMSDPGPEPEPAASPSALEGRPPGSVRGPVEVDLESVAEGFAAPIAVTNAGDGSDDLFVVEQGGRIWRLAGGRQMAKTPFLDVSHLVVSGGEQGLLGLAFHPQQRDNGLLYVNYTDTEGDTVVAEYRREDDLADPDSERVLLRIDQPYSNHNGGHLAFGPDGYLYIGMGDGGAAGDPEQRAQDPMELLGKMLRIDVDARTQGLDYGIPDDNPFAGGAGARPEIWHTGLRNPWRYSFDRATGDLWIGDVGQSAWEEIDRAPAGRGGIDWGWDVMEGTHCYEPSTDCDTGGKTGPVSQYDHSKGCAVTGGYVYRGEREPLLQARYVFGDYCTGFIWTIHADRGAGSQDPMPAASTGLSISSFGESESGELYLTDLSGGGLYRLVGRRP